MGSKIQTQTNFVRFFGGFKGVRGPDEGVVGKAYKAKNNNNNETTWFLWGCLLGSLGTCGSGWVAIFARQGSST